MFQKVCNLKTKPRDNKLTMNSMKGHGQIACYEIKAQQVFSESLMLLH